MSDNQARMLEYLRRAPGWVTAAELSGHLGVSARSVRSYVTRAKQLAHPLDIIDSGPDGYQLKRDAFAEYQRRQADTPAEADTPQDRLYQLVRRLTDATEALDVYELAAALFVSDSTLEADLARVRSLLPGTDLTLTRHGSTVAFEGPEAGRRRLVSRMFRDESARGIVQLEAIQREFASESLGDFKTDLIAMLDAQGYFVNDFGTDAVLLHLAIAVDRARKRAKRASSPAPATAAAPSALSVSLADLIRSHFNVELGDDDVEYLSLLLTTRVITPGNDQQASLVNGYVRDDDLELVRRIVARASDEYLIDLSDEGFTTRLTLHVRNLINRAHDASYSRNPLARSIKTSYPMIYELAVYIASELQRQEHIQVGDDEIAYIAMHVGAHLEQQSLRTELVTCAIICPNYYDMHVLLRQRIERTLGDDIEVVAVITRSDVDWDRFDADLVLTTVDPGPHPESTIVIQPFLTEGDVDRIRQAASRVRRQRRRAQIKDELLQFFDESLFLRNFHAEDEVAMIRALGELMAAQGIIDAAYVEGAVARELMSSTAFTDNLAVPHAMEMTALRTSIAIVINDTPMSWGGSRVNVVAFIAFSAAGRPTFQAVFDQFVEVFADRGDVQRLIRRSTDFSSFIEELVHMMEK